MPFFTLISPFKSTINSPLIHILKRSRISQHFSSLFTTLQSHSCPSAELIDQTLGWYSWLFSAVFSIWHATSQFNCSNGFSLVFYDICMLQHDLETPKRPDPCLLCSSIAHQSYSPPQPSPSSSLPSVIQPVNIYNGLPLPLTLSTDLFFCLNCLSLSQTNPCSVPLINLADSYTSFRSLLRCYMHVSHREHSSFPTFWLNIFLWVSLTFYAISAVSVKLLTEIQPLRRLTIFTLSAQPHVSLVVLSK